MLRFVAFEWNRLSDALAADELIRRLEASPAGWRTAISAAGFRLLVTGAHGPTSQVYLLGRNAGIIVGSLFRRGRTDTDSSTPAPPEIGDAETERICETKGRHLVSSYWGSYVAFIVDIQGARRLITLRSPMGHFPCSFCEYKQVKIFFSFAEDFLRLNCITRSINWDYIRAYSVTHGVFSNTTALDQVVTILPGQCVVSSDSGTSDTFYWNPCDVAQTDVLEDVPTTSALLRETAIACAHSWTRLSRNILHRLSGGLDSSITLMCLRSSPYEPQITCLNFFTPGTSGDERSFARIAARAAGCELVEVENAPTVDLRKIFQAVRTICPTDLSLSIANSGLEADTARTVGANVISSAAFGDQIFVRHPILPGVTEYAHRHGLDRRIFRIAHQAALLDGLPVWKVLKRGLYDGLIRRWDNSWLPYKELQLDMRNRLLDDHAIEVALNDQRFSNAWLRAAKIFPIGKHWQVFYLPVEEFYYDHLLLESYPERIDVTMSQPLVDLCLRIPTYVHAHNGQSRGLARGTFAQDLPQEIVTRTSKGDPSRWIERLARQNLSFARELLLDGELVKRGILDRRKVEEALSGGLSKNPYDPTFALDHVSTEAWISQITAEERRAAA